jgi:hypothetical protein
MAAHEKKRERVVVFRRCLEIASVRILERPFLAHDERFALASRDIAADLISHAPRGNVDQPRARILGFAIHGPLHRRCEQRFLHGVFARAESPKRRITAPSTCGANSRSRRSMSTCAEIDVTSRRVVRS